MCGIVGLFLKDISLDANLAYLLSDMLISMSDRGPDSAGIAIYADKETGRSKFTIQSENPKTRHPKQQSAAPLIPTPKTLPKKSSPT